MILLEREKKKERVTNVKRKYRKLKKKKLDIFEILWRDFSEKSSH